MKTIKFSIVLLLILLAPTVLRSQDHKITVQNTKESKLILTDFNGDLPIEGYSGNEIIIASGSDNIIPPERAKGLKPIYPGGTDNTGFGLSVEKNGNQVSITCLLPFTKKGDFKIRVPDNVALKIESGCERSNHITVTNMKNEIEIKNCHDIELTNVTGPLVLSTISGNIDITFGNLVSEKPFSVNTISGDIDITIPVNTSADITMRTVAGGFYSDFDIPVKQNDMKKVGGNLLDFPLNGGGFAFNIATVSGNIYLRKGN